MTHPSVRRPGPGPFSNRWKKPGSFFQSLENAGAVFPIVGSFLRGFSNRWKFWEAFFQSLETGPRGRRQG